MEVISSLLPFPPISWFAHIVVADRILFDKGEHFEKMSYRNRYTVGGANNTNQLSVPLTSGRNQRVPMSAVLIHNAERWQVQHWRTLTSVYKRSPYWEYYEHSLQVLFETPYTYLTDFNLASYEWLAKQLKLKCEVLLSDTYINATPGGAIDLRSIKPSQNKELAAHFPKYYQVFEDRIGFQPNLSILDLLFSEGPATMPWLHQNKEVIIQPKP